MAQCLSSPSLVVALSFTAPQSHKGSSANMPKMLLLEFCCCLHKQDHLSLLLSCSQKNVGEGGEVLSQLERCSIRHQSDTVFTLSQHNGIRRHYFNSFFEVE